MGVISKKCFPPMIGKGLFPFTQDGIIISDEHERETKEVMRVLLKGTGLADAMGLIPAQNRTTRCFRNLSLVSIRSTATPGELGHSRHEGGAP